MARRVKTMTVRLKGLFSGAFPPRLYEIKRDQALVTFRGRRRNGGSRSIGRITGPLDTGCRGTGTINWLERRLATDFNGLCKWEERVKEWELFRWRTLSDRWSEICWRYEKDGNNQIFHVEEDRLIYGQILFPSFLLIYRPTNANVNFKFSE